MCDIMEFAIESSRREAEITRLEWEDLDEKTRTGLVRDAKHPRGKDGNHRRFRMTPEAWAIIRRQQRTSQCIFPYNPRSIQAAFTRACQILGIVDYHFHNNRHEATSRLFERGYEIHEVALFTLHQSWNDLKRYANLRPGKVRELSASNIQPVRPRGNHEGPDSGETRAAGTEREGATPLQLHLNHREQREPPDFDRPEQIVGFDPKRSFTNVRSRTYLE
jgi:hypothetical protein